jgi:hypothetical protein
MRETHESVHLSMFEDSRVIYIDKVESDQPLRAYSQIGDSPPAHAVATGKVLLAARSDEFLLRLGQGAFRPIRGERLLTSPCFFVNWLPCGVKDTASIAASGAKTYAALLLPSEMPVERSSPLLASRAQPTDSKVSSSRFACL